MSFRPSSKRCGEAIKFTLIFIYYVIALTDFGLPTDDKRTVLVEFFISYNVHAVSMSFPTTSNGSASEPFLRVVVRFDVILVCIGTNHLVPTFSVMVITLCINIAECFNCFLTAIKVTG